MCVFAVSETVKACKEQAIVCVIMCTYLCVADTDVRITKSVFMCVCVSEGARAVLIE